MLHWLVVAYELTEDHIDPQPQPPPSEACPLRSRGRKASEIGLSEGCSGAGADFCGDNLPRGDD